MMRHLPLSQLKLQQSLLSLHTSPSTRHIDAAMQRLVVSSHARLQHALSPPSEQSSPAGLHVPVFAQVPPSQSLLQQSLSFVH